MCVACSYGFVFALLVPYVQLVPVTQTWSLVGLNLSHKTFFYAILTQLVLCQYPSSLIPCLSGILSGMLYVTDFGSVQSWRFPRPIEGFFSANVLPSIASLSPYGNAASSTWQQSRQPNGVLATLDSNGQPVPRSGQVLSPQNRTLLTTNLACKLALWQRALSSSTRGRRRGTSSVYPADRGAD